MRAYCGNTTDDDETDEIYFTASTNLLGEFARTKPWDVHKNANNQNYPVNWPLFEIDWSKLHGEPVLITMREKDGGWFGGMNDDYVGSIEVSTDRKGNITIKEAGNTVWAGGIVHFRGDGGRYWLWFEFKKL